LALLATASGACAARPAPRDPTTAALFRDLERQVTVAAATGWGIDRLEVEEMLEHALDSVCRVPPLNRRSLLGWLADQVAASGGTVSEVWRARGRDLDRVEDLLVLSRIRMVLARAEERAVQDCPFWLEPEPEFGGRQISNGRWQLTFGGGGKVIVLHEGSHTDLLFGGAGRLLLGRVFASGSGLYVGAEIGGSAAFPKDAAGTRGTLLLNVDVVVPVVARFTLVNSYLELEAGWLGRASENALSEVNHGVHLGASVGARGLRTRFFFPGAALGVSLERTFIDGPDSLIFKIGARVALDLDL
jgi:hypothetical protein